MKCITLSIRMRTAHAPDAVDTPGRKGERQDHSARETDPKKIVGSFLRVSSTLDKIPEARVVLSIHVTCGTHAS